MKVDGEADEAEFGVGVDDKAECGVEAGSGRVSVLCARSPGRMERRNKKGFILANGLRDRRRAGRENEGGWEVVKYYEVGRTENVMLRGQQVRGCDWLAVAMVVLGDIEDACR